MCPHCIAAAGFILVGAGSTAALVIQAKGSFLQISNALQFGKKGKASW